MNRDDPIAQLRALDPADEKEIETIVAALAGGGCRERIVSQPAPLAPRGRLRRRPRLALLAVAAAIAALVVTALANPFSRGGGISSAEAKAQVARALDIQGAWHVARVMQSANVKGSAPPRFKPGYAEDVWHAPDGRLLIRGRDGSGATDTTLYAKGERREYNSTRNTLRIHRFVLAADMRDDERRFLPATAADLYRAAYRLGKVRLAGIETLNGRRVYRLAFAWRGASYTLIFDAERRVPISSESRSREHDNRAFVVRVRYTAYQRLTTGAELDRALALPHIPRTARIVQERAIVIPAPVQGAPAAVAARALAALPAFPPSVAVEHATYTIVHRLANGTVLAVVGAPSSDSRTGHCFAIVEIAHRGGEAIGAGTVCAGGGMSGQTRSGTTMFLGSATKARKVELRFAGGRTIRAQLRDGFYFATFPIALSRGPFSVVSTRRDGSVTARPWPQFPVEFTSALAG
jgi:hypothetical protein